MEGKKEKIEDQILNRFVKAVGEGNEQEALLAADEIMKRKIKVRFELEQDDKDKIVRVGFDEAIKMNLIQTKQFTSGEKKQRRELLRKDGFTDDIIFKALNKKFANYEDTHRYCLYLTGIQK